MPRGTPIDVKPVGASPVTSVSITAGWENVIAAGGVANLDNAAITNPETQIILSTTLGLKRVNGSGTTIRCRLGYDKNLTVSAELIVAWFGRVGTGAWQRLKTRTGASNATLTTAASTDDTDGTLKYTLSDQSLHSWDCDGCDEVVPGVEQKLNGTGAVLTNAVLQAKII